ncbi:response regulator [Clostridiaceae bacterium]|nr:response regulator [Clostridium sp.]NBI70309.1 response regulator [Clostridiaceae bacterium]
MYHCHIRIYLTGHERRMADMLKEMPPLEHFTHEFSESDEPDEALASGADVILADVRDMDAKKALGVLCASRKEEAELIVIADKAQIPLLAGALPDIKDIWTAPMSGEELRFRFLRWQQGCKMSRDLWESRHFLEAAINNSPNLIWFKDKEGIHEMVNSSFCRTVNKTREQVQGRGHAYIWDVEQDDPVCKESEDKVMRTGKTMVTDETIVTGEGMRMLTTYKSPLYNPDGSVMGTVGIAVDVTQERSYKQEIIQKNRTLETIFTTMDCGVLCHSMDGSEILSVNRAALHILGYESQNELMDQGFFLVASSVLDEDRQELQDAIRELQEEGDSVSVEYRVRHKNGEILHVMGNVKLLRENGKLFYQRFLLDCTAQKLEEEKNERRQMELVQALSIDYSVVCFFDLDSGKGRMIRSNDSKSCGRETSFRGDISLEESMERYIENFVHAEDKETLRQFASLERLRKELVEKKTDYVNYRVSTDSGTVYFQLKAVRAGLWDGDHGAVLGFRSVDKEIRDEMEKKNLLEDALLQANRASKAKSVFLSNMSHDIRTPMNAIVGFTALAITHIDHTEQVKEYLEKIMSSGNHLLSLINDILDMSRIESGKMHLEEKPCRLPDILHGLRNILLAEIHAKQLELYMDAVDVINENIYCDKLRLNQVLLNLLSNAVKYTRAGGIITVRIIEKAGAPAGYANYEFHIKDTGIGMSEEFVAHIFEPFEREKNSTISKIQGTGLGMAITKNIVDMMNGAIEVKSEQGVGTEFTLYLTLRLDSGEKEPVDIPELKNCRALVVDDDFNTCDSVSYMLQQIGLRAEWTLSGKEAVLRTRQAAMRKDNYCVYVIDWLLPDMNGIEVTRRIRKEMGEDVPIIVLTAYDWFDIEKEGREAGVTAFCSKPLFLSELRSCLHSVIHAEAGEEENTAEAQKRTHTGRILLTEDVALNQEIATVLLEDAGFCVEVADNGQIAVDMVKNSRPGYYQLVLMDVQMPVMNGYEATRAIRRLKNKALASIPIIAMTANAFEEDKQEAMRCGMNGHISKPIDVKKLFRTLDQILK